MQISFCSKEEIQKRGFPHSFAQEAFRYNTEINNWNNPVLCVKVNNNIKGVLYYRHINDNLSQLVNIYSDIKDGGTTLFKYFVENIAKENIYLYISDSALGFYSKFGLKPIKYNKPSKEFQLVVFDKNFNLLKDHYIIKEKLKESNEKSKICS